MKREVGAFKLLSTWATAESFDGVYRRNCSASRYRTTSERANGKVNVDTRASNTAIFWVSEVSTKMEVVMVRDRA